MDKHAVTVSVSLVGGLIFVSIIMILGVGTADSMIFSPGADRMAMMELSSLAQGIILVEDTTITRPEGYFFIYCDEPSNGCGGGGTRGAAVGIKYQCAERCLCVAKLPKKNKPNAHLSYLSDIIGCVDLDSEDGEFSLDYKFWKMPRDCEMDPISPYASVKDTIRRTIEIKSTGAKTREIESIGSPTFLGSTKKITKWDTNDNGEIDVCE